MKRYITLFLMFLFASITPQTSLAEDIVAEEIQEFGLVTSVEDGAYPMFNVTIEFPERGFSESFNVNAEGTAIDAQYLMQTLGKYVSFIYTSQLEHSLFEIKMSGKFLLGDGTIYEDWQNLEGILQNAESETMGDLPDVVTVIDAAGTSHNFPMYITPEMVHANGQFVTVYFATFVNNSITKLKIISK